MKSVVFDFYKVIYDPEKDEIREDVLIIIKALYKQNIPLFLFTSSSSESLSNMDNRVVFLKYFDDVIYESSKSQPKAFQKLIERIDSLLPDIILIDDREDVVEQAKNLGIYAIRYDSSVDLKCILKEFLGDTETGYK